MRVSAISIVIPTESAYQTSEESLCEPHISKCMPRGQLPWVRYYADMRPNLPMHVRVHDVAA